jgi:hypothetical protein
MMKVKGIINSKFRIVSFSSDRIEKRGHASKRGGGRPKLGKVWESQKPIVQINCALPQVHWPGNHPFPSLLID